MLNISRGLCKMAPSSKKKPRPPKSGFPEQQLHSSWRLPYSFLPYVFRSAYNMRQPRIISPLQSKTPKCRNVAIVIRMNHRMRMIPQTIRRPWNSRSTIHSIFLFDVYLRLCLKNHAANPLGISLKVVFGSIGCVLLHFLSISMSDIQRKSSVEPFLEFYHV